MRPQTCDLNLSDMRSITGATPDQIEHRSSLNGLHNMNHMCGLDSSPTLTVNTGLSVSLDNEHLDDEHSLVSKSSSLDVNDSYSSVSLLPSNTPPQLHMENDSLLPVIEEDTVSETMSENDCESVSSSNGNVDESETKCQNDLQLIHEMLLEIEAKCNNVTSSCQDICSHTKGNVT